MPTAAFTCVDVASFDFGITAFLGPFPSPEDWIVPAVEAGVSLLEIRAEPGFAHPSVMTSAYRRYLREAARAAGLRLSLHAPLYDMNPASSVPQSAAAAWAELASCVFLAAELGADVLVIHPGEVPAEQPPVYRREAERRFSFGLQSLVSQAESVEVRLALENKQRGKGEDLVRTPDEHVRYLREVPGLCACLDLGHLNTLDTTPHEYIGALGEHLVHVHLHDNNGKRDEHLSLGKGSLDWQAALCALEDIGYRGTVVLELPSVEDVRSSLALIRGWE